MEYIKLSDITDAILECDAEDVEAGNAAIERRAMQLGVSPLPETAGYAAKRYGICVACYTRCVKLVGTDASAAFNGANGTNDIYAEKAKLYKSEIVRLEQSLSAADFGIVGGQGAQSVSLYRA